MLLNLLLQICLHLRQQIIRRQTLGLRGVMVFPAVQLVRVMLERQLIMVVAQLIVVLLEVGGVDIREAVLLRIKFNLIIIFRDLESFFLIIKFY